MLKLPFSFKKQKKNKKTEVELEDKMVEKQIEEEAKQGEKKERSGFFGRKKREKESQTINIENVEEIIDLLPLDEEKKKEWKEIYRRIPKNHKEYFEALIEHFNLPYSVEELLKKAQDNNTLPLTYLTEIERLLSIEDVLKFNQEYFGIKWDKLFSAYEIINPLNSSKRIGEFLYGDGVYSKHELGLYSPFDFPRAIKILKEAFIDQNSKYESLRKSDIEIVLVNPILFEHKELLQKSEDILSSSAEDLKKKFKEIIKTAIRLNVSDIHFSPKNSFVEVKIRLFGDLYPFMHLTHQEWKGMQRVIKTMARESGTIIDVLEWREGQDAKVNLPEFNVDLRLAFTPSLEREEQFLVIRILYKGQTIKYEKGKEVELIKGLGYLENDAKFLAEYVMTKEKGQGGGLIMAGATGSGKSMTLNALLALIPQKRSIKTIEDPVEYRLLNADQHEVMEFVKGDRKIQFGFLEAVKEFMRQDPDIIFVGEWRKNPELTSAITYAIKTGHFVLTTLHSSRVVNIPDLLLADYEVDQPTQANTLSLLISQRLLKKVCPNCGLVKEMKYTDITENLDKIPFLDNERLFEIFDAFEDEKIKIFFDDLDLKNNNSVEFLQFHKLIGKVIEDKDFSGIKIEIPEVFDKGIENFKQVKEEKRVHRITDIKEYKSLLKKAIGEILITYIDAYEMAKKYKKSLTKEQREILKDFKTALEEYFENDRVIVKVNLSKFLEYFLYPQLRKSPHISQMRQLVRYYSPEVNPQGCEKCRKLNPLTNEVISAGIVGRTPIYEFLVIDNDVKSLIFKTTEALEIEKMLIKKKKDYITNKDFSLTSKGKSFIDTFVEKLKKPYIWQVPYSEVVKLKQ